MGNMNWVDYVVIGVFFLSTLAGLMRGLVKELFSLLAWVAAFVLATLFATRLAAVFSGSSQIQSTVSSATNGSAVQPMSMISIGVSFLLIFIGVLILGKIISFFISSAVEGGGISFVNRFLGAIFGFGRGVLLVLVMMFLVGLSPMATEDYWTQSYFVHAMQPELKWLDDTVSPSIQNLKTSVGDTFKNVNTDQIMQQMKGTSQENKQ